MSVSRKINKSFWLFIAGFFIVVSSGCQISLTSPKRADGGIVKSSDQGKTWQQKVFAGKISQGKKTKDQYIDNINVKKLFLDPNNSQNIYLISKENGLYFTNNGATEWKLILSNRGVINDIAIDYKVSGLIYLALDNKIYKTPEAGKDWQLIYTDSQPIISLATDAYDNQKIYAGTSDGRLLRSLDFGREWLKLYLINGAIDNILINPKDTRLIYLLAKKVGLWYSANAGEDWQLINKGKWNAVFPGILNINQMIFIPSEDNGILVATSYGLLRSSNGIDNWQAYQLLTPASKVNIDTVAVNPRTDQEIYYTVGNIFYSTFDGGQHWTTAPIPTARLADQFIIDPQNNDFYLGLTLPPKPKRTFGFF